MWEKKEKQKETVVACTQKQKEADGDLSINGS